MLKVFTKTMNGENLNFYLHLEENGACFKFRLILIGNSVGQPFKHPFLKIVRNFGTHQKEPSLP